MKRCFVICVLSIFMMLVGVQSVYATTYVDGDVLYIDLSDPEQRELLFDSTSFLRFKRLVVVGDGVVNGDVEVRVNNVNVAGEVQTNVNPDNFVFDFEDEEGFGRALVETDVVQIKFIDVSNIVNVYSYYQKAGGSGLTPSLSQTAYDFFLPARQLVQIPVGGLNGIMLQVGGTVSTVLPICLGILGAFLVVQLILWFRRLFL